MLFSPFSLKAQNASVKCEWQWKWVWETENEYNSQTGLNELRTVKRYKYVNDCISSEGDSNSAKTKEQNIALPKDLIEGGALSAPADSPIIGTWKQVEYATVELPKVINNTVVMEKTRQPLGKTMTYVFSQNGIVEIVQYQGLVELGRGKFNWTYTPAAKTSGTLKIFLGDKIITKGDVSFVNKNKLELVGTQDNWTRE